MLKFKFLDLNCSYTNINIYILIFTTLMVSTEEPLLNVTEKEEPLLKWELTPVDQFHNIYKTLQEKIRLLRVFQTNLKVECQTKVNSSIHLDLSL